MKWTGSLCFLGIARYPPCRTHFAPSALRASGGHSSTNRAFVSSVIIVAEKWLSLVTAAILSFEMMPS